MFGELFDLYLSYKPVQATFESTLTSGTYIAYGRLIFKVVFRVTGLFEIKLTNIP
jgi:hypothetical protein